MYLCLCLREKGREGERTFIFVLFGNQLAIQEQKKFMVVPKFKDMDEKLQNWFYSRSFFFLFSFLFFNKEEIWDNHEIRVRKLEILLKIKRDKRKKINLSFFRQKYISLDKGKKERVKCKNVGLVEYGRDMRVEDMEQQWFFYSRSFLFFKIKKMRFGKKKKKQ